MKKLKQFKILISVALVIAMLPIQSFAIGSPQTNKTESKPLGTIIKNPNIKIDKDLKHHTPNKITTYENDDVNVVANMILDAIPRSLAYIDVSEYDIDFDRDLDDLLDATFGKHPEYNVTCYGFSPNYDIYTKKVYYILFGYVNEVKVDNLINSEAEKALNEKNIQKNIKAFEKVQKAVQDVVDAANDAPVEDGKNGIINKLLAAEEYVSIHYAYDIIGIQPGHEKETIYDVWQFIDKGRGVCQAYTDFFAIILTKLGLENMNCPSNAMNHVWNLVKIGTDWYHMDVTWDAVNSEMRADDGVYELGRSTRQYFLQSDDAFKTLGGHTTWNSSVNVSATDTSYDQISEGVFADAAWWANVPDLFSPVIAYNHTFYFLVNSNLCKVESSEGGDRITSGEMNDWLDLKTPGNAFSGLGTLTLKDGKIIYHDPYSIYEYDPSNDSRSIIFELPETERSEYLIYSVSTEDGLLRYWLLDAPLEYLGLSKIIKKSIGFKVAEEKLLLSALITGGPGKNLPSSQKLTIIGPITLEEKKSYLYESLDPNIATVTQSSKNGNVSVKGIGYGQTVINVYEKDSNGYATGDVLDSIEVNVYFSDVTRNFDSAVTRAINWAADNNITGGYNNKSIFKPTDSTRRDQFAIFLYRHYKLLHNGEEPEIGETPFRDITIKKDTDTYKAISWCFNSGIVGGYSVSGKPNVKDYRPTANVTRLQVILMLYRYAKFLETDTEITGTKMPFPDTKSLKPGTDSYNAVMWGSEKQITAGTNGLFQPNNGCQRQQLLVMLFKYANL